MQSQHHDFRFELIDEWWKDAGMEGWSPGSLSYRVDKQRFPDVREVAIENVAPVRRNLKYGVFNDDGETGVKARDRVISILRGFLEDAALPPVDMVRLAPGGPHEFALIHGAHRFFLSIIAGFTYVPAIVTFPDEHI